MKTLMSEVQKRLFVIDQSQNEDITYNVPMVLKSDGILITIYATQHK